MVPKVSIELSRSMAEGRNGRRVGEMTYCFSDSPDGRCVDSFNISEREDTSKERGNHNKDS